MHIYMYICMYLGKWTKAKKRFLNHFPTKVARFFLVQNTKTGKYIKMTNKYTK
jgi:hypothetical protein